jgi:phosphoglycerol transferase
MASTNVPPRAVSSPRRLAVETAVVATVAWVWAFIELRFWSIPKRLPIDTRSDATLISAMVKTIGETGWYLDQPRLGAPFGQEFHDFPHGGETFQLVIVRAMMAVIGDWGLVINLYFLAGFGVLAAVTFLVLRSLRFAAVPAGVAAVLYTFLPYHVHHGEMHLWRSAYVTAPLAGLLLVWATSWRERFLVDPTATGRGTLRGNLRTKRVLLAVAVAVVIAGTETMTTAFTMTLLVAGAFVGALVWREPLRLAVAGALVAVMAATFLVLSVPTLVHFSANDTNEEAGSRLVTESELWGLKLIKVITPEPDHRIDALGSIGRKAQEDTFFTSENGQALGILGTIGFIGALLGAFKRRPTRPRPDVRPGWDREVLDEHATTYTLLSVLFGTISGFAVLTAMVGFSQVRVWNRIVLIIAFFAMVTLLRWAELLVPRVRAWAGARSLRPGLVLGALAVVVLAFGLVDTRPPVRASNAELEARHDSDRRFVDQITDQVGEGASIFQLPVVPFPEAQPVGDMLDYDHLRGYLADDGTLNWSYGAIKGRPEADWQIRLRDEVGPVGALPALLGLGFDGLWIDTAGYVDRPEEVEQLIAATGVEPLRSPDGRFLFLDLGPYRDRLERSDEELRQASRDLLGVDPPEDAG